MTETDCFTVTFEGDIALLPFNPMDNHETPFGRVIEGLGQDSASIVATDRTVWLSRRPDDPAPTKEA